MSTNNKVVQNFAREKAEFISNVFSLISEGSLRRFILSGETLDIDRECKYPSELSVMDMLDAFNRNGIASRIVSLYPCESWQVEPSVYENPSSATKTPFEKSVHELLKRISLFHKLEILDIIAGIGRYGILLLGFDDGKDLSEKVPSLNSDGTKRRGGKKYDLIYARPIPEVYASIKEIDTDVSSPRYGMPLLYEIQFVDSVPSSDVSGFGSSFSVKKVLVHWTRVIHFADNQMYSDVYGIPRLQQVYNHVLDLKKVLGASGQGYWNGGFPGISLETHPSLEYVDFDEETKNRTKEEIANFQSGLQRYLATVGMTVRTLSPNIADPSPHIRAHLTAISIAMAVPSRIFMGAEEGKLASNQDSRIWVKRLRKRQTQIINNYLILPTLNRLIAVGAIKENKSDIKIFWPDLAAPSGYDKAIIFQKVTDALSKYISGKVYKIISVRDYLHNIMSLDTEEVDMILESMGGESKIMQGLDEMSLTGFPGSGSMGGDSKPVGRPKDTTRTTKTERDAQMDDGVT